MDELYITIAIVLIFIAIVEITPTRKWGCNPKKWWCK